MSIKKKRGPRPFGSRSPEEAETLQTIAFRRRQGASYATISRELNALQVLSPQGKKWQPPCVMNVLRRLP